jgi:hypothetical protein
MFAQEGKYLLAGKKKTESRFCVLMFFLLGTTQGQVYIWDTTPFWQPSYWLHNTQPQGKPQKTLRLFEKAIFRLFLQNEFLAVVGMDGLKVYLLNDVLNPEAPAPVYTLASEGSFNAIVNFFVIFFFFFISPVRLRTKASCWWPEIRGGLWG